MIESPVELPEEQQGAVIDFFLSSSVEVRQALIGLFGPSFLPLNIKERVFDFPSACSILSINESFVSSIILTGSLEPDSIMAAIKLQVIILALNENWNANMDDKSQNKYYVIPDIQEGASVYYINYTTTTATMPLAFMLASDDLARHLIKFFKPLLDIYFLRNLL